jgi:hypothetical protein
MTEGAVKELVDAVFGNKYQYRPYDLDGFFYVECAEDGAALFKMFLCGLTSGSYTVTTL